MCDECVKPVGQTRVRLGTGRVEIFHGEQDGLPILVFLPHGEAHRIGEKTRDAGGQITDEELTQRRAVVIECPNFLGVDVLLYAVMQMWCAAKEAQWDKEADVDGKCDANSNS